MKRAPVRPRSKEALLLFFPNPMKPYFLFLAAAALTLSGARAQEGAVTFEAKAGPGKGKHVVFLGGDEEYRGEECLPVLAKILSGKHGFKTSVCFATGKDGTVDPNVNTTLSGSAALDSADAIVILLRWRQWEDVAMARFDKAFKAGKPVIALRTSTHAFKFPDSSPWKSYNKFGKNVVGEDWVSHWGNHKVEATRGVIEPAHATHPVLRGVTDVFGDTDVYEAYPPADAAILLRGQVLKGMAPSDPPAAYSKKRATDQVEQDVNTPMMPVAWVRDFKQESGVTNKVFTTTMGSATDFFSEDLRRLVVNGVYWSLGMDVPAKADVGISGTFTPSKYGFDGAKKGLKPADFAPGAGK